MPSVPAQVPDARRERLTGLLYAAVTVLLWSGFVVVSRLGAKGSLAPVDIAALRFGVSGLVMLPFFLRYGTGGLRPLQIAALCFTAGIGYALLSYSGFRYAPAAHGAVLMPGLLPFFTAALAVPVLKERWTPARALGLAVVATGIALLAADQWGAVTGNAWRGDLLFISASLSWATFSVLARKWAVRPLQATAVIGVFCMLAYLPPYLLLRGPGLLGAPLPELLLQGLYQGVLAVVVALITYTRAVQILGPGLTTTITSLTPAVAALSAVPLLGESLSPLALAGIAAVTAGVGLSVALSERLGRARKTPAPAE